MRYLVTGCLGFIGSAFCRYVIRNILGSTIIGVNRNSNQKHLKRLEEVLQNPRFTLVYRDLSKESMVDLLDKTDYVINFAARTHVDYSIKDPYPFLNDNVISVVNMLEAAKKSTTLKRFIQISTDEVYGQILVGRYTEESPSKPKNFYSASKSAADGFVLSYFNMFNLPILISRTENNYGIYQSIEKVIPTFVKNALENKPLPVYGDGKHIRCWLHVDDHVRGILHLLEYGEVGNIYHIAGEQELENIELAKRILKLLNKPEDLIQFIPDHDIRPGHDRRYALDVSKLKAIGWEAKYNLDEGLKQTISWYKEHREWFF